MNIKLLFDELIRFAIKVHDGVTKWTGEKARLFRLPVIASTISRYFSKPAGLVGIEVFVGLSLVLYYFFLLLPLADPARDYGRETQSISYFSEYSAHPFSQEDFAKEYPDVKTRVPGKILTGWVTDRLYDYTVKNPGKQIGSGVWNYKPFAFFFSAYYAAWLLLLFGLIILYRKDALLIMLGVFSGLMLNMAWVSWQYVFPWDLPSMFFFTWAILTYDSCKKIFPLMVIIWLGALFKETTLCCALLILLGEHWSLKKRLVSFIVTLVAFSLAKKLLLVTYDIPVQFFSANNFFSGLRLPRNFMLTFIHPGLNHVIFVNAGALVIMMLLPWRTYRQLLLKLIAVVFTTGIVLFGEVIEFRVWYEILPLGWILISEALMERKTTEDKLAEPVIAQSAFQLTDRTRRALKGFCWLGAGGLVVFFALALVIADFQSTTQWAASLIKVNPTATATPKMPPQMPPLDSKEFLNNLAWGLATSPEATNRNGVLAVQLAERACQKCDYKIPAIVGTLAAAYAEVGRFDEAIAAGEKAYAMASAAGDTTLRDKNKELLGFYRNHEPYREVEAQIQIVPRLGP